MSKVKAERLSDDDLADKARRYAELKAEADDLNARAIALGIQIRGELAHRKTTEHDHAGVRTLVLASTRTTYDYDRAKARLGRGVTKLVTPVIGKAAVLAGLEAGRLSEDDVAAFRETTTSEPYIRVTVR